MTTPHCHSLLFTGALLLALQPELHAADRSASFRLQTRQTAPTVSKKKSFLSLLFGGKSRQEDNNVRPRSAAVSLPRSGPPQLAASQLQPSRIYSNPLPTGTAMNAASEVTRPYAGAPVAIIRTYDNTHMIVHPLPLTPSRVVVPPVSSISVPPPLPPSPHPTLPVSKTPAPATANVAAASPPLPPAPAPVFARPVPGKPGLVYPPGLPQIPANIVDVTGMSPGSKARDPVSNIIFVVP